MSRYQTGKFVFVAWQFAGAASLALAFCASGCDDESDAKHEGARTDEEAHADGALYLAATRVWDDTTTTSYFHVFSSLDAGTAIDAKQAREVPGPAKLFAHGDLGWFAIGDGEAPKITRFTLDDAGKLKEGRSISLQQYGVDDLWDTLYFVSENKAYYPDTTNSQLIVWNPSKMEIEGVVDLPKTARKGFLSYYGLTPLLRGDKLIFSVGWFDWNDTDSVVAETGLVVLDTKTDKVIRYDVDKRCGGITQVVETDSGDAYFVSSALAVATYRLGRIDTEPCALRVADGEDRFDPNYLVHLSDLTDGALAGEPAPGGGDDILIRVFDEDLADVDEKGMTWSLTGQEAWRWMRWNTTSDDVTPVDDMPPSTADAFWFQLDGKVFASETKSDYSKTTLIELRPDKSPKRALTFPGFLQGVARIR